MMGLVDIQKLFYFAVVQIYHLRVFLNTLLFNALSEHRRVRSVGLKRHENSPFVHAMRLRYVLHCLVLQERDVLRAERRIRGDDDASLVAEVDDVLLRARRVHLDLIYGRDDLAIIKEPLEELHGEVRHAFARWSVLDRASHH